MASQILGQGAAIDSRDNCKLVVWRGRKFVASDRKRELARQIGVDCILLRWVGSSGNELIGTEQAVCGFQHVKLSVIQGEGGISRPRATWDINEETKDARAEGSLDFVPNEMNIGYAWVPDSAFNRVRLAVAEIHQNALWVIEDEQTRQEIQEIAKEIVKDPEYIEALRQLELKKTRAQIGRQHLVATGQIDERNPIELENLVLERKLKEVEAKKIHRDLKARLRKAMLELGGSEDEDAPQTADAPKPTQHVAQKPASPVAKKAGPKRAKLKKGDSMLRAEAREAVYRENPEVIAEAKRLCQEQQGKATGWAMTSFYREQVLPLINARYEELMRADKGIG